MHKSNRKNSRGKIEVLFCFHLKISSNESSKANKDLVFEITDLLKEIIIKRKEVVTGDNEIDELVSLKKHKKQPVSSKPISILIRLF